MILRTWLILSLPALPCISGGIAQTTSMSAPGAPPPPSDQPSAAPEVAALVSRLSTFAGSRRDNDQEELTRALNEVGTLDLLDEPDVRDKARPADLRVAAIIRQLESNPSDGASKSLDALARNPGFNASWQRQELLIRAFASRRPLSRDALLFLDDQTKADSVNLHIAIDALCDNLTQPALALLETKLSDQTLDPIYKVAWIRGPILLHRREPALLAAAEKWLLDGAMARDVRNALAEAIFDYKPDEWYSGTESFPQPPDERQTKPEAAQFLRRIGQAVIDGDFPEPIKGSARNTLERVVR